MQMRKFVLLITIVIVSIAQVQAQQRTVSGKVTDEKDVPIANASVVVKGTNTGTMTNAEGNYSLTVPPGGRILVISSVDFEPREFNIGNQTIINATLKAANKSMSEVIVVAYGTAKKGEITSS